MWEEGEAGEAFATATSAAEKAGELIRAKAWELAEMKERAVASEAEMEVKVWELAEAKEANARALAEVEKAAASSQAELQARLHEAAAAHAALEVCVL